MDQHGPGKIADRLDRPFCNTILMVGADPGEANGLMLAFEVGTEFLRPKDTIVREKGRDLDAQLAGLALKDTFAQEGIISTEGLLMVGEELPRHVINEDSAPNIPLRGGIGTSGDTARESHLILVHRDAVPRLES